MPRYDMAGNNGRIVYTFVQNDSRPPGHSFESVMKLEDDLFSFFKNPNINTAKIEQKQRNNREIISFVKNFEIQRAISDFEVDSKLPNKDINPVPTKAVKLKARLKMAKAVAESFSQMVFAMQHPWAIQMIDCPRPQIVAKAYKITFKILGSYAESRRNFLQKHPAKQYGIDKKPANMNEFLQPIADTINPENILQIPQEKVKIKIIVFPMSSPNKVCAENRKVL